jgi:hypothetical protein
LALQQSNPQLTAVGNGLRGTQNGDNFVAMRDVIAGLTPIAAGLALAVIIHRTDRPKPASKPASS